LEIGYDKPGSLSGSTTYNPVPGCYFLCLTATATWKHETTLTHIAALGLFPIDTSNKHGALFGKIGLYGSSTNSWGDYGTGGGTYSHHVSGAGPLLGAGYIYPFTPHLSARAAADIFFKSESYRSGQAREHLAGNAGQTCPGCGLQFLGKSKHFASGLAIFAFS
jgi:hypothetical protein